MVSPRILFLDSEFTLNCGRWVRMSGKPTPFDDVLNEIPVGAHQFSTDALLEHFGDKVTILEQGEESLEDVRDR